MAGPNGPLRRSPSGTTMAMKSGPTQARMKTRDADRDGVAVEGGQR